MKESVFGTGADEVVSSKARPAGRAKRAFARLFAATAALTGAAMTAKTVARTAAAEDGPDLLSRRLRIAREGRDGTMVERYPDWREGRRKLDMGVARALPRRARREYPERVKDPA